MTVSNPFEDKGDEFVQQAIEDGMTLDSSVMREEDSVPLTPTLSRPKPPMNKNSPLTPVYYKPNETPMLDAFNLK